MIGELDNLTNRWQKSYTEIENAWDRLETPKDWHEPEFVTREKETTIPLWVTLVFSLGLWLVLFYMASLLWRVI